MKLRKCANYLLTLFSLFIAIFVSTNTVFANSFAKVERLNETWRQKVPVSGVLVKGFAFANPTSPVEFNNAHIFSSKKFLGHVCVVVSSRDGRYVGRWLAETSLDGLAAAQLPLKSEYIDKLAVYPAVDLAVLVFKANSASDDCRRRQKELFSFGWNANSFESQNALIQISSSYHTATTFIWTAKGKPTRKECNEIPQSRSIAFDTVCEIPSELARRMIRFGIRWLDESTHVKKIAFEVY